MISVSKKPFSKKNIVYTVLVFLAVSAVLFMLKNSPFVEFIQGEMQKGVAYHKAIVYSFGKEDEISTVSKLQKELQSLNEKVVDYELIKRDNIALRSQFETSGESTFALTHARILGFTGDNNLPETLVVNVGLQDGVKVGMAVIFEKYLVGKISKTSLNYSVVTTVLNPKFQTLAKIPATNANGIIFGSREFMLLDRVVITDKLEDGGNVVTRGEVDEKGIGIYPDLIIGKISSISKNETAPFQSAQVTPIINFSKLTSVFVVVEM